MEGTQEGRYRLWVREGDKKFCLPCEGLGDLSVQEAISTLTWLYGSGIWGGDGSRTYGL